MPLEVRELVIKVDVGQPPTSAARPLAEAELAALRRDLVAACLAELRLELAARDER